MGKRIARIARAAGRISIWTASFALALPALAVDLNVFKDSPGSRFNDRDMQLFLQTLDEALDKGKDGETRKWSNADTGAGGEIKSISAYQRAAVPCKTVQIDNHAKSVSASGRYNFCKQASGQWAPSTD